MSSGTGWRMISWKNFSLSSILLSHWVIENIGFTRRGQEYLTKLAHPRILEVELFRQREIVLPLQNDDLAHLIQGGLIVFFRH